MFGKKNKNPQSITMNNQYPNEQYDDAIDDIDDLSGLPEQVPYQQPQPRRISQPRVQQQPQQPIQQVQQVPQMQQNSQSMPMQQIQQQVPIQQMPPIQPKVQNQAIIMGMELNNEGYLIYKVLANFQLNLGYCQLIQ